MKFFMNKRVKIITSLGGQQGSGKIVEGIVTSIQNYSGVGLMLCIDNKYYIATQYIVSIEII